MPPPFRGRHLSRMGGSHGEPVGLRQVGGEDEVQCQWKLGLGVKGTRGMGLLCWVGRLVLCGLGFTSGLMVSGAVLPAFGLVAPAMPAGTDAGTVLVWFFIGSLVLAAVLSLLARRLAGGFLARWAVLGALSWIAGGVAMVVEAAIFMRTGAVASGGSMLFTALNFLAPSFASAAAVTWLFRAEAEAAGTLGLWKSHVQSRSAGEWLWRVVLALAAFPIIYVGFGTLVLPLVSGYYQAGAYELAAPSWAQILPVQLARSTLFLAVSLPVIVLWHGSRRGLMGSLGLAMFVLVGFMSVITSYWFPWQMRLFHGLEILADSVAYSAVVTVLLGKPGRVVQ
jgi:hypothetical protein